jgi:hypothetical protein
MGVVRWVSIAFLETVLPEIDIMQGLEPWCLVGCLKLHYQRGCQKQF